VLQKYFLVCIRYVLLSEFEIFLVWAIILGVGQIVSHEYLLKYTRTYTVLTATTVMKKQMHMHGAHTHTFVHVHVCSLYVHILHIHVLEHSSKIIIFFVEMVNFYAVNNVHKLIPFKIKL
jgi:hypothetical protein